ncbi:FG-GAP-like repeat-containing protein [Streptomyces sindenensis]|uniref:FG-GAP-like repeat-containing protein n=1 Tax=Streptomyces sindenensis TaxID=67363 RepID=UPI00167B234D|nr:FG-GAP-like repeat-containing protein [Streptomyces sindenensis]
MKRRAWLTVGAVVLGGAGVVTAAVASPGTDPVREGLKPRKAEVHSLDFKGTGSEKRDVPRTSTEPFSLVGVTWVNPDAEIEGTAEVRTRNRETGEWGDWLEVHLDQHLAEKRDARADLPGMSEPLWVGPSDAVQGRVLRADGKSSAGLPKGLELTLVDPGVTAKEAKAPGADAQPAAYALEGTATPAPAAAATETETASPTPTDAATQTAGTSATPTDPVTPTGTPTTTPTPTTPTAPPSTVTRPPMTLRTGWGPDESLATNYSDPEYIDRIQAVFVHHTADSNNYSCSESPAMVRAIYAYHVTPRPGYEGWKDIGYNFLVDKCGQIFEGREGGADLPVLGAHTYGFNSYSTSVALLGNFETGRPSRAALDSAARVAAWKLGQYGVSPSGTVTLTAAADTGKYRAGEKATLSTISGHRDGFATLCPGVNLYSELPAIRRFASGAGRNSAIPTSDFNRDGITDLVIGTPKAASSDGSVHILPGGTDGPVAAARRTIDQSSPGVPGTSESDDRFGSSTAYGDLNGDGFADLIVGAPGENGVTGQANTGSVTALYGPALTTGKLYWTNSDTRTADEGLGTTVAAGDFNADGKADIFSVAPGVPGRWYAWDSASGVGTRGYLDTATSYTGRVSYSSASTGDFNGDGYADAAVSFRDTEGKGRLVWLKGSPTGLQRVGMLTAPGGRSLAAGDLNGDGYTDLAVGQPSATESGHTAVGGAVTAVFGSSAGLTSAGTKTLHQDTTSVPGLDESGDGMGASVSIGDVDLDGYADILVGLPGENVTRNDVSYVNAGSTLLLRSTSTGPTGTGAVIYSQDTKGVPGTSERDDRFGSAVSLTDLSGYSRADVAIGAEGEDAGNGTVLQLDNSSASGIVTTSGVFYGLTELGTPAAARIGKVLHP